MFVIFLRSVPPIAGSLSWSSRVGMSWHSSLSEEHVSFPGQDGAPMGPGQGRAGFVLPRSSASADGHPCPAAQSPAHHDSRRELAPGQRKLAASTELLQQFPEPGLQDPSCKRITWDLLLSWRRMELAPWNQSKLLQAACKISFGADLKFSRYLNFIFFSLKK